MIVVSSSASFGSDGVTITSDVFSMFISRRWSAGSVTASNARRVLWPASRRASIACWLMRAWSASVSSVMKFCATQPDWFPNHAEFQQRLVGVVEKRLRVGGRGRRGRLRASEQAIATRATGKAAGMRASCAYLNGSKVPGSRVPGLPVLELRIPEPRTQKPEKRTYNKEPFHLKYNYKGS